MRAVRFWCGLAAIGAAALSLGAGSASAGKALVVTTLSDTTAADGLCTLREATENHNAQDQSNPDCGKGNKKDTITFGVSGKIFLTSELPAIEGTLTIDGANVITIDGSGADRIMETNGSTVLTLRNVTLAHGNTGGDGGGLFNLGTATLDHTTFSNNTASGNGGGVYSPAGSLKILDSGFDHNSAGVNMGGVGGQNATVSRSRLIAVSRA